ncbi:WD repeat-containing protein 17-like isoform X2 [Stegodyphus dumicola]|uniref:WD repeat-containing protein 17-like isoform X2 n=1 Tax=Stegodyphus dumicola TaxID=202533 RepID=UPI0015AAA3F5|nr:WD repeat-containing protein 17-like isoform X2 [Stegodyphus dumicola]
MTLIRQVGLIPAGCQPWNLNVVDASGSRFAYAATLAIYIYEWNPDSHQFYLHSIMSEHKKTISAIAWHLKDKDILASSSTDFKICIWHVAKHKLLASLNTPHAAPTLMSWFTSDEDCVAYTDGKGPIYLWKYMEKNGRDGPVSHPLKEISTVSSNITQMSWHPSTPGRFALGHADGTISLYIQDSEAGVLRIWIVSKEKPEESLRLKQVGFKAVCVLPSESVTTTKEVKGKVKFSSRVICLFFDGGVGVYNLRNSSWDFLRNMGHLETIFDCQFKPDNCDLLATASFDGTVKVWNVNSMEAVDSSHGDASIIYSLSWAPGDMDCLAAATSKSGIFIWNLKKGRIRKLEDVSDIFYLLYAMHFSAFISCTHLEFKCSKIKFYKTLCY